MSGESECPKKYRDSTISTLFRRALSHCSSWPDTQKEIDRVHQLLINNGYSNNEVQSTLRRVIDTWYQEPHHTTTEHEGTTHRIFYKSQMSNKYKEDEKILKDIIKRNVTPTKERDKISLTIYYRNKKTSSLILRNHTTPKPHGIRQSHVVYKFTCPEEDCTPLSTYVGRTTTTLSRRITLHLQQGGPKQHLWTHHRRHLDRETMVHNTEIVAEEKDLQRLTILEAVIIKDLQPIINVQTNDFSLLPSMKPTRRRHLLTKIQPPDQRTPIKVQNIPAEDKMSCLRRSARLRNQPNSASQTEESH
ncbi:uncharacterized protein LOC143036421 [Oratosquilla oratoria]|uniref:uncharacterized protein LOC143036421 n=1 Tax=Oratosquilla oratoria TaxID=337810 RepID=UPI003F759567